MALFRSSLLYTSPRVRLHVAALILFALSLCSLFGCTKKPQLKACNPGDLSGCVIEDVDLVGNDKVSAGDIEEKIATAETSHVFGGVLQGVPILGAWDDLTVEYEHFDRFVLERDLARIERYYRARGYYDARVRAGRVMKREDGTVRVEISIDEGEPVRIGKVDLVWKDWSLPIAREVTRPVIEAKNTLRVGRTFEEEPYESTKKLLVRAMTDRGFAYANVEGKVNVDLAKREAHVTYTLELGPYCRFGKIRFEGLEELPEGPLRSALAIEEGDPFSTAELESAEVALGEFGLFASITMRPEMPEEGKPRASTIPLTVVVQKSPLGSVKLGIGAEVGSRFETHGIIGWEQRNFLGGLRRFSVEGRPGLVFSPTQVGDLVAPDRLLPEASLRIEFRQPLPVRLNFLSRAAFSIYQWPGSKTGDEGIDPPVGFRQLVGAFGFERAFLNSRFNASVMYNIQRADPFSYEGQPFSFRFADPPGTMRGLTIPWFSFLTTLDNRRARNGKPDRVNPHKGYYVANEVQVAGYLWGDADDVRLRPEFRAYLPISKRITLGFRLVVGLLFPTNYRDDFTAKCANGDTPCEDARARDLQLLMFRGFFSGGANSNRGYGYNGVGPYEEVTSWFNSGDAQTVPTGGTTLWESSLELRIPITETLGSAIFVDGSDVTRRLGHFRLTHPHLSTGVGLRYQTPVGPLRADLGYRIPCAQVWSECTPSEAAEGEQQEILGLPMAISVAIGHAF